MALLPVLEPQSSPEPLQNQAVKRYIPKHRNLALALLLAVVELGARCCCISQLMKQVQANSPFCIFLSHIMCSVTGLDFE